MFFIRNILTQQNQTVGESMRFWGMGKRCFLIVKEELVEEMKA